MRGEEGAQPAAERPETSRRPVLVGVDFSRPSEAALLWAGETARRFGAPLTVAHVVHDPAAAPGAYASGEEGRVRSMEDVARERLQAFLEEAAAAHPELGDPAGIDTILVVGLPATRLVEVAERLDAQLIVVGSQGRTGLSHVLLGSKAERVAQLSPVPVTIVKHRDEAQP